MTTTKIMIEGNLAENPATEVTENGTKYTRLLVVVDTYKQNGNDGYDKGEPEVHRVTAFGALGENTAAQLRSGDRIVVGGELKFRTWLDRETNRRRQGTEIIAENVGASTRFANSVVVNRDGRRPAIQVSDTGPVAAPSWPTVTPGIN